MTKEKRNHRNDKQLTAVELELMNILWRLGEGTVNDVMEALPKDRRLAYTSVSTMLRILETKKNLTSRKEGRGHVYSPLLSKESYESASLKHMVNKVFDDSPASLVRRLLDAKGMSQTELEAIRKILDEKLKS